MGITIIAIIIVLSIAYQYAQKDKKNKKELTVFELDEDVFRKQLIYQLNVEVYQQKDNHYTVGFQGGTFEIIFGKDNKLIRLGHGGFYEMKHEDVKHALFIENELNKDEVWSCYHTENVNKESEFPLQANLTHMYIPQGTVKQTCEAIKMLLLDAFEITRRFEKLIAEEFNNKRSLEENCTYDDFEYKLSYLRNRRDTKHSYSELGNEYPDNNLLSIAQLTAEFDQTDFGCLNNMRIIIDDRVELFTDINQIMNFNIRDYILNHQNRANLDTIMFRICFEKQDLLIHLRKAEGCTEKTMFFRINVMRSSSELEHSIRHFHGMMEIRFTTENEDYWEAKYMVEDALEKRQKGNFDTLTPEQQMIIECIDPSYQTDIYWAKKYFNNSCYLQSLYFFKRIHSNIKNEPSKPDSPYREFYNDVCLYIGAIYMQLNMTDRAYYYLHVAQRGQKLAAIEEFMNCLWAIQDWDALVYYRDIREKALNAMQGQDNEEPNDALQRIFFIVNRHMIHALINNGDINEAESLLKSMIESDYDTEYATNELNRIKELRNQSN